MFPFTPRRSSGSLTNNCDANTPEFTAIIGTCFYIALNQQSPNIKTLITENTLIDLDQNVFGVFGEPAGVSWVVCPYGLKQLLFVAAVERRLADQHLVQ